MPFIKKSLISLKKIGTNQKICGVKPHRLDPGLTIVTQDKFGAGSIQTKSVEIHIFVVVTILDHIQTQADFFYEDLPNC